MFELVEFKLIALFIIQLRPHLHISKHEASETVAKFKKVSKSNFSKYFAEN